MRLSPEDMEIPVPGYYRRENQLALREREKLLDTLGTTTFDPRTAVPRVQTSLTVEQAIQIIQVCMYAPTTPGSPSLLPCFLVFFFVFLRASCLGGSMCSHV